MAIAKFGKTASLVLPFAALTVLTCRQAAGVLFDVPPPVPASTVATTSAGTRAPEDTVRPPIESVRDADSILALLPKNADGGVDWVAALRQGVIKPRKAPPGTRETNYVEGFGYDVVRGDPEALFPHSAHVDWLTCQTCHPSIVPRPGFQTSMDEIDNGKSCGICHRTVAFSNEACSRCHPSFPPAEFTAVLDTGIVLARAADSAAGPGPYPPSRFAHDVHRIRYRCSACHPSLFPMRAGADTLDMASMRTGASCGACHDGRAAFAIADCDRCHVTRAARPS